MAVIGEPRKLLCICGKQIGLFDAHGLHLRCRGCRHVTVVPYRISTLQQAVVFVEEVRRQARRRE